ncbi:hypothetical protein B5F34_04855 [Mediterranea sp. An20]|nr:hypothetical protein B5F34_04855 [Mediterranea sp. An20]
MPLIPPTGYTLKNTVLHKCISEKEKLPATAGCLLREARCKDNYFKKKGKTDKRNLETLKQFATANNVCSLEPVAQMYDRL